MSRKQEHRIADIIQCRDKILRFTRGMNQEQLAEQELVQDELCECKRRFPRETKGLRAKSEIRNLKSEIENSC